MTYPSNHPIERSIVTFAAPEPLLINPLGIEAVLVKVALQQHPLNCVQVWTI